jgi:hypothetical protein
MMGDGVGDGESEGFGFFIKRKCGVIDVEATTALNWWNASGGKAFVLRSRG